MGAQNVWSIKYLVDGSVEMTWLIAVHPRSFVLHLQCFMKLSDLSALLLASRLSDKSMYRALASSGLVGSLIGLGWGLSAGAIAQEVSPIAPQPIAPQPTATQALPSSPVYVPAGAAPGGFSAYSNAFSDYVLGPGDRLSLKFFNVPEYDGERTVTIDGTLILPLIGKLPVTGLTLAEATQAIGNAYASYLRTPGITLDLVAPRPIQIGIAGEVNKPGSYEVPLVNREDSSAAVQWPTVVEAVQLAGGITNQADIREVEIRRFQSGGVQTIRLNLWEILQTGSVQSDITLRNGDAIRIPTATALNPEELTQLSAANFSPDSIQVTVVGEVTTPGQREVEPNAPLNQALLAAGGFDQRRADKEVVELIRLNPDGTVTQREIPVSFEEGINEETNPALQANDVVVVGRSGRATFADNAETWLGPISTVVTPFRLLLELFD